jgi:serine/threonine-protein kinase RsbW
MAVRSNTTIVSLAIPAKPEYLVLGRLVLTGLAGANAFDDDVLGDLKLALTEAAANAIVHAYADGADGGVVIRYELSPSRIEVTVTDDGQGIAGEELAALDDIPSSLEPGESGMGLSIIRALVDELSLEPGPGGRGVTLRFAKAL